MSLPQFPHASEEFKRKNRQLFTTIDEGKGVFAKGTLGQVLLEPEDPPPTRAELRNEKELQDQIAGFLNRHNVVVIRSRMDRETSNNVGTPDLIFAIKGIAVGMECKMPTKKLTKAQADMMRQMTANGWRCFTVFGYDEAVQIINKIFLESLA